MRNPVTYFCDVCDIEIAKSDNRKLISIGDIGFDRDQHGFHCEPWCEGAAESENSKHVCGDRCAHVMFGWWLDSGSLKKPKGPRSEPINQATDAADDQRSRPRTGPIEKIADIAYGTLRKHATVRA